MVLSITCRCACPTRNTQSVIMIVSNRIGSGERGQGYVFFRYPTGRAQSCCHSFRAKGDLCLVGVNRDLFFAKHIVVEPPQPLNEHWRFVLCEKHTNSQAPRAATEIPSRKVADGWPFRKPAQSPSKTQEKASAVTKACLETRCYDTACGHRKIAWMRVGRARVSLSRPLLHSGHFLETGHCPCVERSPGPFPEALRLPNKIPGRAVAGVQAGNFSQWRRQSPE